MSGTKTATESLANFKRNTSRVLEHLQESGTPLVLTVKGEAKVVVQDATAYQRLVELLERLETVVAVKESQAAYARGEGRPAKAALEELRRKHSIPRAA